MNKYFWNGFCFIATIVAILIYACANRGYPEGGLKDENPPKVVQEIPESYTMNFKQKQIDIYFNEYVQLKEIANKFVMSPPANKKAKISLRGKYIRVLFQDTLKQNATYSLDFGDAIVDNNEGNPFGDYRYVFSTGSQLDTMELSGQVLDVESQLPVLGATVLFYTNHADTAAVRTLPDYVARTDSSGIFRVTNIKNATYRILAIDDANRDNKFLPEEEKVGFVDSLVTTISFPMTQWDTIRPDTLKLEVKKSKKGDMTVKSLTRDSIVRRDFTAFGPSNLLINMFSEQKTQLYLVDGARKERERLDFVFSVPTDNQLKVNLLGVHLLNQENQNDWFVEEHSIGRDTIRLWIKEPSIYKIDSLTAQLSYLRTDSLGKRELFTDTIKLYYKDKPISKGKLKKQQDSIPEIKFMGIVSSASNIMDLNRDIALEFDRPIDTTGLKNIRLLEKLDTIWIPTDYRVKPDTLKIRKYYIQKKWKPETEYKLVIDSMGIYSIYGLYNNKLENTFKTKAIEDYGNIIVHVTGVTTPIVVQLYQGDKDVKVLAERRLTTDGDVTFNYLNEGVYQIRTILDRNGNGKWDTGNYLKGLQPEDIKYLPTELNIKKNFDIEQDFNLSKTYKREDPSKKKVMDDKKDKRKNTNR